MKERIAIYGLMHRGRCLYVGQTTNPLTRQHVKHPDLGAIKPDFKIFEWVPRKDARKRERYYIAKYRALGQAKHNLRLCSKVDLAVSKLKPGGYFTVKTPNERWQVLRMAKLIGKPVITRKIKSGFAVCYPL